MVGDTTDDCTVISASTEEEISLPELWRSRRAVVVFLRQFGCRFCKQQVFGLNQMYPRLREGEIALIAVGLGTIEQAQRFQQQSNFQGELYIDTHSQEPRTYDLFKLHRGRKFLMPGENEEGFGPYGLRNDVYEKGLQAVEDGFQDSDPSDWTGNTAQIGGTFVLGPGNSCDFVHRSQYAGDLVDLHKVMEAATGSSADGELFVYPSTQQWSKNLKVSEKFASTSPRSQKLQTTAKADDAAADTQGSQGVKTGRSRMLFFLGVALAGVAYLLMGAASALALLTVTAAVVRYLESAPGGGTQKGSNADIPEIQLYTPNDVDRLAVEAGIVECDCSFIASTDVTQLMTEVGRKTSAAGRPRTRSNSIDQLEHQPTSVVESRLDLKSEISNGILTPDDIREFQKATCYFREFLAKGHPQLGRKGPTCPFVPVALKKNSMYVAVVRTAGETSAKHVETVARSFVKRYHTLEPTSGRLEVYKAVLLIFPNVPIHKARESIDDVQAKLKRDFVTQGLMIGEFHMRNNACGLRNPHFYPLRTPTPALAIRRIVPSDLAFLDMSKYDADTRVRFLESYLQQFEGVCPAGEKRRSAADKQSIADAKAALKKAREELETKKAA